MTTNHFAARTTARIRAILAAKKLTVTGFAKILGVDRKYVDTRINDRVELPTRDLARFSKALGYKPEELIAEDFRLHEQPEN